MSEVAEKTAEVVAENVEEAIDGTVEVLEIVRNNPKVVALAAIAGTLIGTTVGYFVAKQRLEGVYEQLMTEEIADAKAFYANLNKVDEDGTPLSPQDVMTQRHGAEAAAAALSEYQGRPHDEEDEALLAKTESEVTTVREARIQSLSLEKEADPAKGVHPISPVTTSSAEEDIEVIKDESASINVFVDNTFDLDEEKKYRTDDRPYIITHDEYFEAGKEYDTQSLTYFEVDDTLIDEHEKPLEDTDAIVGDDHLVRFGSGSQDQNIVYVRNDRLETDYEITRSRGSYLEEVLGMPDESGELKHSNREIQHRRRREFRHGDG